MDTHYYVGGILAGVVKIKIVSEMPFIIEIIFYIKTLFENGPLMIGVQQRGC